MRIFKIQFHEGAKNTQIMNDFQTAVHFFVTTLFFMYRCVYSIYTTFHIVMAGWFKTQRTYFSPPPSLYTFTNNKNDNEFFH